MFQDPESQCLNVNDASPPRIDHLVFACSDLGDGVDLIARQLGSRPVKGGRHPAWGTHNALLSLGPRCYLEVIAPDPDNKKSAVQIPEVFSRSGSGTLSSWAAGVQDLSQRRSTSDQRSPTLGGLIAGSRQKSDGGVLSWLLTDPMKSVMGGLVPFIIDWGDSDHPAAGLPSECFLRALHLHHPEPELLGEALDALGLSNLVEIKASSQASVVALIESPRGIVEI